MPKISIIVPVYNAENYIDKCVDSILGQTFTDFELILIDDGSADHSPQLCDEYAKRDNRIIVIHQKNAGVGAARNAGLDAARGEYVAFVDSDDWIDLSFLEKCMENIQRANCDVCIAGFYFVNENVVKPRKLGQDIEFRSSCITPLQVKELLENVLISNIWGKLYRRCIIGQTRFDTSVNFGEDLRFCFELLKKDIAVAVLNWAGYYYRLTPNGLTSNRVNEKKCRSVVKTYQYLYQHAKESGFWSNKEYMAYLDKRWSQDYFGVAYNILSCKMERKAKENMLRLLMADRGICARINAMDDAPVSDATNMQQLYVHFLKIRIATIWQEAIIDAKMIIKKLLFIR